MNKYILQAGFALAMVAGSTVATAAIEPRDLVVQGTIKTPTCTLTAEFDGVYDYGVINKNLVPTTGHLALSTKTQRWSVDCGEASTYMAFQIIDNRADTVSSTGNNNFGLGSVPGVEGSKIGYYTVTLGEAKINDAAAFTLKGSVGGSTGTGAASTSADKTQSHSWTDGTGSRAPFAGSKFDMAMSVTGYIANATTMGTPITESIPLDGHLTLNYSFGL